MVSKAVETKSVKSAVSDDIMIELRAEARHYAVVRSESTGLRYVVDLGLYLALIDLAVLETLPAPRPETDSLTVRIAGYHDGDWRHFLQVVDLGSNVQTFMQPKEYYEITSFGEDDAVPTFNFEPDLHVVWIEETEYYDQKIVDRIGRCFMKGIADMSVVTHLASLQGSSWVEFVENECEIRPEYTDSDHEEAVEKHFKDAGFEDEFQFVHNGESDYFAFRDIEAKVGRGETVRLTGFDETEIDTYRLHPHDETRGKALREIMDAARLEAESFDITGVPSLVADRPGAPAAHGV